MADYSMLGAFSTGGASSLNAELIDKLKEAERTSTIQPIEDDLEEWDTELETITTIQAMFLELKNLSEKLSTSNEENVFDQVYAETSGTSAVFDAATTKDLEEGTIRVDISQLAQKDVHQSGVLTDKTALANTLVGDASDVLKITIGSDYATGTTYSINTNQSFEDMVSEINNTIDGVTAAIEEVGTGEYRIVIKSDEAGDDSNIFLGELQTAATGTDTAAEETAVGFTDVLKSQNLVATVDGVEFNMSSNKIVLQNGLTIDAVDEGVSTISISKDNATITSAVEDFIDMYNMTAQAISDELGNTESSLSSKSDLRTIMSNLKDFLFKDYGSNGDKNIFNYGFELDEYGNLSLDTETFEDALNNNYDDIMDLFANGEAVDGDWDSYKGFGQRITEFLDDLDSYNGAFTLYTNNMNDRKDRLEENLEKAQEDLDDKYDQMASQFADYASIISQMESSFSSIAMMIDMETSG